MGWGNGVTHGAKVNNSRRAGDGDFEQIQDKDLISKTDCKYAHPLGTQKRKSNDAEILIEQPGKKGNWRSPDWMAKVTPKELDGSQ